MTIGSPLSKRLALSLVSLLTATRRCVTEELASMITGGWTSTLMFRRCAMAVASSIFEQRVDRATGDEGSPLVALGPSSRQELVLLAVLAPLLASCVSVPYDRRLFASDASLRKGAFTYMRPDPEVTKAIWLSSDARGFYTKLEGPFRATLAALGEEPAAGDAPASPLCWTAPYTGPSDVPQFVKGWGLEEDRPKVARPLGQRFDFLLVGPGPASLVTQLREAGLCCGPILDASTSRHFRLDCPDAIEWAMHLLAQGRIGSLALYLSCGALSPLALGLPGRCSEYPARVRKGLCVAAACFALFWLAWRVQTPCLLVTPGASLAASSPRLRFLCNLPGVNRVCRAACPNRCCCSGSLLLVARGLDLESLNPEGSLPLHCVLPPAEPQPPGHCPVFSATLRELFTTVAASSPEPVQAKVGFESLLVNDLLSSGTWQASWTWPCPPEHINVLETKAFLAVLRQLGREGGDKRCVQVVDSSVALGATTKGRSSARSLRKSLLQACALQLGFGLYPAVVFGPTRLNTSDAPTRDTQLPTPASLSICRCLGRQELLLASAFRQLPRASANWLRLACLLVGFRSPAPLGGFLRGLAAPWRHTGPPSSAFPAARPDLVRPVKDFDATLGYPGEGPLEPRGQRDVDRQARRSASALPSGRPVLPRTRSNRARLLGLFDAWLAERGSSLKALTSGSPLDPAAIGQALTNYGRDLYDAGRPYGDYSETVNAVGALCPSVRRQLQGPWDLAFSWMAAEPYTHHVPMPAALLLALLTCSLLWGWLREAGVFALAWGSLLRIGEATEAKREDLVLPGDVFGLHDYVLLSIREPKTRLRVARHQAAKLEQSDLVALVCLAFGDLPAGEALWPRSNQTLRARLDKLLARLGVCASQGQRSIDLGSFRPGGATHLLQVTEDSELVRRRGRWASPKVMEIYLQEVSAVQFLPRQPPAVRATILGYAKAFPQVFAKAQQWSRQKVPPCTWYTLFSSGS